MLKAALIRSLGDVSAVAQLTFANADYPVPHMTSTATIAMAEVQATTRNQ